MIVGLVFMTHLQKQKMLYACGIIVLEDVGMVTWTYTGCGSAQSAALAHAYGLSACLGR